MLFLILVVVTLILLAFWSEFNVLHAATHMCYITIILIQLQDVTLCSLQLIEQMMEQMIYR